MCYSDDIPYCILQLYKFIGNSLYSTKLLRVLEQGLDTQEPMHASFREVTNRDDTY